MDRVYVFNWGAHGGAISYTRGALRAGYTSFKTDFMTTWMPIPINIQREFTFTIKSTDFVNAKQGATVTQGDSTGTFSTGTLKTALIGSQTSIVVLCAINQHFYVDHALTITDTDTSGQEVKVVVGTKKIFTKTENDINEDELDKIKLFSCMAGGNCGNGDDSPVDFANSKSLKSIGFDTSTRLTEVAEESECHFYWVAGKCYDCIDKVHIYYADLHKTFYADAVREANTNEKGDHKDDKFETVNSGEKTYYYNTKTRRATWTAPAVPAVPTHWKYQDADGAEQGPFPR